MYFFEEEIKLAKQKWGEDMVKVVNMANMTMQAQAELVLNSAVLLVNQGGGSSISTFLPRGSSAIVFWHGSRTGARKDHWWYEAVGYFRTSWLGEAERQFVNHTMALIDQEIEKKDKNVRMGANLAQRGGCGS